MSLFFESIRIAQGRPRLLPLHQQRIWDTQLAQGWRPTINLEKFLNHYPLPPSGVAKLRISYDQAICEVILEAYTIKTWRRFQLVDIGDFNYTYKHIDRTYLQQLKNSVDAHTELILCKNGKISDTTYSNLVFYDGMHWVTPTSYLLKGVMRTHLLTQGIIREDDISTSALSHYTQFKLINAMMDFAHSPTYSLDSIG